MAFDMQENNKAGFDMTKVKAGDKLLTRGGREVVFIAKERRRWVRYPFIVKAVGYIYQVGRCGSVYDCFDSVGDIIGFADFHQQARYARGNTSR